MTKASMSLHTTSWFSALALLAIIALTPEFASAQDKPTVTLNAEQSRQIDKAGNLAREGELQQALDIYDALLGSIKLDLLFLNRGRVLQRLGACQEAKKAFDQVPTSPSLFGVDTNTLIAPLKRYNQELTDTCPGSLNVACTQADMALSLVGTQPKTPVTCGATVEVPPGTWKLVGKIHGQTTQQQITIRGVETTTVTLALARKELIAVGRILLGQSKFKKAQEFFQEALRLQESQDTWLYIGESLLGEEQCQLAFISISEVENAPPSSDLSPLEVAQRLELFQRAFQKTCGEHVQIRCVPSQTTLRINSAPPQVCSSAPIFLPAGPHTITGSVTVAQGNPPITKTRQVQIKPSEFNNIDMVLIEENTFSAVGWTGFTAVGLGAASLIAAVVIDRFLLVPETEEFEQRKNNGVPTADLAIHLDKIETLQTTNKVLTGTGAAFALVGGALVLTDAFLLDKTAPEEGTIAFNWTPEEVLVLWNITWP